MAFKFETLEIWQDARKFINKIYEVTKNLPKEERFGLIDQLRRATVSVALNIAEGANRNSNKEKRRFCEVAITSIDEVVTALFICLDQKYITKSEFNELYADAEKQIARTKTFLKTIND